MRQAVAAAAVLMVVLAPAAARAADPAACAAANKRIAYDLSEIAKAEKSKAFHNRDASIEATRLRQLNQRIAQLNADIAKANVIKKKACVEASSYDGTYSGVFPGTTITITFTVTNGAVSGDLNNNPPLKNLDPKTGNVYVKASFLDADCGTPLLHFDLAAKTATGKNVTCKLSGLSRTGDFVARRA